MHLLIVCAAFLAFAIFLDRSRVKANGLLFVLEDYVRRTFRWVTLKRIIYVIGIVIFVIGAWQAVGIDWAFIAIGGDAMLYLEIVSAIYFVAARGYARQIITPVVTAITGKIRKNILSLRSRSRGRKAIRHISPSSDDGDAEHPILGVFAFCS